MISRLAALLLQMALFQVPIFSTSTVAQGAETDISWRDGLSTQTSPRLDMKISNQPLDAVVSMFANASGKTIILGQGVKAQQVSAFFENVPFDHALRSFALANELCVVECDGCLLLVPRTEYMATHAKTEVVQLSRADPGAIVAMFNETMAKKGVLLDASFDARTRCLVLRGDPEQIALLKTTAMQLDRSLATEVYSIRYASVGTIAKAIKETLNINEKAIGSVVVDERANRLIIHEIPENLSICKSIIASLDVPVQSRVFSTGNLEPRAIADQIAKGELEPKTVAAVDASGSITGATTGQVPSSSPERKVQVVEGTNQIIVTDTPERLEILEKIMIELNGNIETKVFRTQNATPQEIADVLKVTHTNINAAVDIRTGSLIITANRERISELSGLIGKLDSEANIQVEIEAKIMLVGSDKLKEYGLRIFQTGVDGFNETLANININPNFPADSVKEVGSILGQAPGSAVKDPKKTSGNFLEALQPNIEVQAVLRALESDADTKVLSNPKIRMLVGRKSTIFSGSSEPYKEVTFQNDRSVENVKFIDVGVTFEVTPFVSQNSVLTMDVATEFSMLRDIRDGIPVVDTRRALSTVECNNGETVFLGGLISQEDLNRKAGIPVLRSIPALGFFFGAKKRQSQERELLIVLTPHIERKDGKQTISDKRSQDWQLDERIKDAFK